MGKVKEGLEVDPNLISQLILEALHFTKAGLGSTLIGSSSATKGSVPGN